MEAELYKMTMEVVSDAIKILGPAIITAIVGYKVGKSQLLLKIEELNKNNQFKAREKIFEFHKEKLVKSDEAIESLNNSFGYFSGMNLELENDFQFTKFINQYIIFYMDNLPFHLNHINDELQKYSEEFPKENEKLLNYIQEAETLEKPANSEEANISIFKLLRIYNFSSHCLRLLIEKEALDIFSPYIE